MNDLDTLSWLAEQSGIRSLRAAVCHLNGVIRGKRIPVEQAEWSDSADRETGSHDL